MLTHHNSSWEIDADTHTLLFENGERELVLKHKKDLSPCTNVIGGLNRNDILELVNVIQLYLSENKD